MYTHTYVIIPGSENTSHLKGNTMKFILNVWCRNSNIKSPPILQIFQTKINIHKNNGDELYTGNESLLNGQ